MKTFQKAPLALAITALMVAPYALAEGDHTHILYTELDTHFENDITVDLEHNSTTNKYFDVDIDVYDASGNSYSGALVDSKQVIDYNVVDNQHSENNATVGGSAGRNLGGVGDDASGNIGINVAAGDNNAQANDAALSASDAHRVFGQAEAYSAQSATTNTVTNAGSPNTAHMGNSALRGATGNIGVNIAAGVGNIQQNSLAASSNTSAGSARATAAGQQTAYANDTDNVPYARERYSVANVDLDFELDVSDLILDQEYNLYPDDWEEGGSHFHPEGSASGHLDLDDQVQATRDDNTPVAVPDYNNDGGALAFRTAGDTMLEATISGEVPVVQSVNTWHSNDATLDGNALRGASGNIGVNIAAGTNNMQRNSLAIASSTGNGGGEPR
ncbi:hypothetical protein [Halomonas sp. NCCP-2165]|nr:hypothetical protein [Halomonas sp. NCCP-2165]GKW48765.1 hypothetical protein NCCP2165_09800 [Halomonas sp. NCCP-2165]